MLNSPSLSSSYSPVKFCLFRYKEREIKMRINDKIQCFIGKEWMKSKREGKRDYGNEKVGRKKEKEEKEEEKKDCNSCNNYKQTA